MRITRLRIQNFRSINELNLDLDDITIFIGPNNAGKTAILEALRVALTRRWGRRGTGFTEYDIHCPSSEGDPRVLPPISIEIVLEEDISAPWDDDMVAALDDIVTINATGSNLITLKVTCAWSEESEQFEPSWQFFDSSGNALSGAANRATNLSNFFNYIPLYWLGALRDALEEFGPRSSHWGALLKSVKIPNDTKQEVKVALDALDTRLLDADPRLAAIAETVGQATHVAITESPGAARLRMLPLNTWDLLSRASVVLRNSEVRPWLPLGHHGQGLQSLSVIFLLHAAVVQLMSENLIAGMEPIFAIEEPEVHLHPQAARTLWNRLQSLPGQKLATTHSPYFVQHVPLHNLRIVRMVDGNTKVYALPRTIVSQLEWNSNVEKFANGTAWMLSQDTKTGRVASSSWFDEDLATGLANCWRGQADAAEKAQEVNNFRHSCRVMIPKSDEIDLGIQGRRLRGEVFFAQKWIMVEGQCEYVLMHALGEAFQYPLDQHGIAVVDFQNSGNPAVYAALAEAFGFNWRMIIDGDAESNKFRNQLLKRGLTEADVNSHVISMTPPNCLEDQLISDGHEHLLRSILDELHISNALTCSAYQLKGLLKKCKTEYAASLAKKIIADSELGARMPSPFVATITALKAGAL